MHTVYQNYDRPDVVRGVSERMLREVGDYYYEQPPSGEGSSSNPTPYTPYPYLDPYSQYQGSQQLPAVRLGVPPPPRNPSPVPFPESTPDMPTQSQGATRQRRQRRQTRQQTRERHDD